LKQLRLRRREVNDSEAVDGGEHLCGRICPQADGDRVMVIARSVVPDDDRRDLGVANRDLDTERRVDPQLEVWKRCGIEGCARVGIRCHVSCRLDESAVVWCAVSCKPGVTKARAYEVCTGERERESAGERDASHWN
jgi:hypothetical protein